MNVIAQAREWLLNDPHEETQHELRILLERAGQMDPLAVAELHDCFRQVFNSVRPDCVENWVQVPTA